MAAEPRPNSDAAALAAILRRPLDELPNPLPLVPVARPFRAEVAPPGSKSLTIRALLLAALASGESILRRPLLDADDARRMIDALRVMGAIITPIDPGDFDCPEGGLRIIGVAGRPRGDVALDLGGSGAATRFLAAAAALADAPVVIDGAPRMRDRPIGELGVALRGMGVGVEHLAQPDRPPLRITPPMGGQILRGHVVLPTTVSSQFVSALLMLAPWTATGVTIEIKGEVTSKPYILMTLELLRRLGAKDVKAARDLSALHVGPGPLDSFTYDVEADASGATYFWAAGAITPGSVCRVIGLTPYSIQGDIRFGPLLGCMGAQVLANPQTIAVAAPTPPASLQALKVDMSDMPDAAMTLASVCCFAQGVSRITGLRTLRAKETDRIAAVQSELSKIDVNVRVTRRGHDEGLTIAPPPQGLDLSPDARDVVFDTYDDHRMAMSLALIGLRRPNVSIRDPTCVAKTYPTFWSDLARLYA